MVNEGLLKPGLIVEDSTILFDLFDSIDEGFHVIELVYDKEGIPRDYRFIKANAAFERHTGLADVAGKLGSEIAPDTEYYWFDAYHNVVRTGLSSRFENYNHLTERWYEVYALKVGDEQSKKVAIVFKDISERKNHELRQRYLLKLSDEIRTLSNSLQIQKVAVDLLGEYLQVNQAHYCEVAGDFVVINHSYGNGLAPMTGKFRYHDFCKRLTEDYYTGQAQVCFDIATDPAVSEAEKMVLSSLNIGAYISVPLVKKGVWVSALAVHSITPRKWKQYEIELVQETAERTWAAVERAQAEEALRENEEKFRILFENMDEGYCIIQMLYDDNGKAIDWRFLKVNAAFQKHNGLVNATGKTMREFAPGIEQKWMDIYGGVAETGESVRFEEDSDVLGRIFDLYAFRIDNPKERKVAVLFTDVTQRKQAEKLAREREEQLKQLLRQRDEFIGIASHELKTPITSIKGYVGIMKERLKASADTEEKFFISRLNNQIDRLTTLINHLLNTTKISEGLLKLDITTFDPGELLAEMTEEVKPISNHKFVLNTEQLHPVTADSERIGQVMTNLLTNAVKYSPDGSTITVEAKNTKNGILVSITDEGYGIPEEDQRKIFERFFRVKSNNMDSYPGMGLGLYISAQIIYRHQGHITVESKVGKGSTFSFGIPYKINEEA